MYLRERIMNPIIRLLESPLTLPILLIVIIVALIVAIILLVRTRTRTTNPELLGSMLSQSFREAMEHIEVTTRNHTKVSSILAIVEQLHENPEAIEQLKGYPEAVQAAALSNRADVLGSDLQKLQQLLSDANTGEGHCLYWDNNRLREERTRVQTLIDEVEGKLIATRKAAEQPILRMIR